MVNILIVKFWLELFVVLYPFNLPMFRTLLYDSGLRDVVWHQPASRYHDIPMKWLDGVMDVYDGLMCLVDGTTSLIIGLCILMRPCPGGGGTHILGHGREVPQ